MKQGGKLFGVLTKFLYLADEFGLPESQEPNRRNLSFQA